MSFKHLFWVIPLFPILFSCGVKQYYTFETDSHGSNDHITLLGNDQLRLEFSMVWYSSSGGSSTARVFLKLKNKRDFPFLIKDIAFETVSLSNKPTSVVIKQIEIIGLTKIYPKGGWEVPVVYDSFDHIEEVNRTLNPYSSDKDLKHIMFTIPTLSYKDVSKSPNTTQINILLNAMQSGKPVQYKQKVTLYKKSHRYFWFLRDD